MTSTTTTTATATHVSFDIVSCPNYISDILKNYSKLNPKQLRNMFEYEDFYSYHTGSDPQKKSDLFVRVGLDYDSVQNESYEIAKLMKSLSVPESLSNWPHNGLKINEDVHNMVNDFVKKNHLDRVECCCITGLSKDLEWFGGMIPCELFNSWQDA